MVGVWDIEKPGSAALYAEQARAAIEDIAARGKLPILAGGTGLYIDAVLTGGQFAGRPDTDACRLELEALARREGIEALRERLRACDPESYERLHPNDQKRIIRALEVCEATGRTISEHNKLTANAPDAYDAVRIGLSFSDRAQLYDRINRRVDDMMARGLLDEAKALMAIPNIERTTAAQAIGYKELFAAIRGEQPLDEAVENLKTASRHYAKRQLTWFMRDRRICWLDRSAITDPQELINRALACADESG